MQDNGIARPGVFLGGAGKLALDLASNIYDWAVDGISAIIDDPLGVAYDSARSVALSINGNVYNRIGLGDEALYNEWYEREMAEFNGLLRGAHNYAIEFEDAWTRGDDRKLGYLFAGALAVPAGVTLGSSLFKLPKLNLGKSFNFAFGRDVGLDKLSPYGTTIKNEINAIQNLGQRFVSSESLARRAKIDQITRGIYQRRFESDLAGQDYVYRAVRARDLQYYDNGISGPLGSSTYFSLEGGETLLEHMTRTQMRDMPDLLLRIPVSEIKSPSIARPYGYTPESMRPTQLGWEYEVNSYPQYGRGGYHQFIGTTEKFDPSWIYQDWRK